MFKCSKLLCVVWSMLMSVTACNFRFAQPVKNVHTLQSLQHTVTSLPDESTHRVKEKETLQKETVKAVWAATVYSLDYPAKPTTDSEALKKDIDDMMRLVKKMGYNTLFFQVRPAADAFYKSDIFPWSQYLTGSEGVAPSNGFDPLEYAVSEAHENGIALHAWINPYRVTASEERQEKNSILRKYPELVVKHSDGKLYLNPGEPGSNELVTVGVLEIIRNYDVDGIHLDDYFYPEGDFPDEKTFAKYGQENSDIGEWRRNNTTDLITKIHNTVKTESEDVVFSVSPCGIWANAELVSGGSETKGKQAFFDFYADSRLWVRENKVDWIIPQIYWNIGYETADFEELINWWDDVAEGTNVKVCIGQAVYKAADAKETDEVWYGQNGIEELKHQNELISEGKNVNGYAHYRLGSIKKSEKLSICVEELNN